MSPTMLTILAYLAETAKENNTGPVACTWCNNWNNVIKYGTYRRYNFDNDLIKIQRYLCKHDKCRRTFSMLPHPLLRITRFSLCVFNELMSMLEEEISTAEIAWRLNVSWPTAKRATEKARRVLSWLRREAQTEPSWAPSPCMNPSGSWSDFIRMFAAKFYPKRYGFFDQHNMYIVQNQ